MKRFIATYCSWLSIVLLLTLGLSVEAWAATPVTITCGNSAKHAVAITFDDGPSPKFTPQILALLKEYGAKATFFVLGEKIEKYPDLIKAEMRGGHELGNHTYSHPHLVKSDQKARERELERTGLDLSLLGCPNTEKIMRPPYSEYDKRLVSYLDHTDRELILWSVDSGDWRGLAAPAIIRNVLSQVKNGSIIIFHDEYNEKDRHPTVEALKVILPFLQKEGYQMVTVSELLS
jgi:peptidoglycan/xylan/chitin deacetylase (PgdA/CDA1 family)